MGEVIVRRNKEQELRVALRQIREAIDLYKLSYDQGQIIKVLGASGYPPTLNVLEDGVDNAKNPNGSKIFFLRKIPKDPFASATTKAIDSWGLRSYSSDPVHPEPGEDVFDVYSKSSGIGLNGIPYREW
jgi:general secretion pathway protein G